MAETPDQADTQIEPERELAAVVRELTSLSGRPIPPEEMVRVVAALRDLADAVSRFPPMDTIVLPQTPFNPSWDVALSNRS